MRAIASRLRMVLLMGLFSALLASCGSSGTGFEKKMDAALAQVAGVIAVKTQYRTNNGMSTSINMRITASPDASLDSVLTDSLHTFSDNSGSTKGAISVAFYVFPEGDEENGIWPDAVGLNGTPTVEQIREFAKK